MSFSSEYSLVDRCLHHIAFCHPLVQKVLGEIESDLYSKKLGSVSTGKEIFVTGLPRSGTTLILEMLYRTGDFSTFTYRDMPFVLSPLIWSKISASFQKKANLKERAHGDGMLVSFDSPEAFEEVIWLTYLKKEIVKKNHLSLISSDQLDDEFIHAMREAIRKILYLDQKSRYLSTEPRYLSKNNANISRIDTLLELFPDSIILIPFRDPLAHISSLKRQHEHFLTEQSTDSFTRRYMKWLGHYEFGKAFKPINFDNWLRGKAAPFTTNNDFWMEYWTKAYEHVLKSISEKVLLVDFDNLILTKETALADIASRIGITDTQKLITQAADLRLPNSEPVSSNDCSKQVLKSALNIYSQLKKNCI